MVPKDYFALCDGFEAERNRRSKEIRLATYFTISPHADKSFNFHKFTSMWPIDILDKKDDSGPIMLSDLEFEELLNLQMK